MKNPVANTLKTAASIVLVALGISVLILQMRAGAVHQASTFLVLSAIAGSLGMLSAAHPRWLSLRPQEIFDDALSKGHRMSLVEKGFALLSIGFFGFAVWAWLH